MRSGGKASKYHYSDTRKCYMHLIGHFYTVNLLAQAKDQVEPKEQSYGMVAIFKGSYGNLWDLLQMNEDHSILNRIK